MAVKRKKGPGLFSDHWDRVCADGTFERGRGPRIKRGEYADLYYYYALGKRLGLQKEQRPRS